MPVIVEILKMFGLERKVDLDIIKKGYKLASEEREKQRAQIRSMESTIERLGATARLYRNKWLDVLLRDYKLVTPTLEVYNKVMDLLDRPDNIDQDNPIYAATRDRIMWLLPVIEDSITLKELLYKEGFYEKKD